MSAKRTSRATSDSDRSSGLALANADAAQDEGADHQVHPRPNAADPPAFQVDRGTLTLLDRERRGVVLQRAIGQLSAQQRAVVTSVYFGGHSQAEVAAEFALPLSIVRRQLFRGLRQIGGMLDDSSVGG
jgi:DNA-directed RNA polymerase specialized sigma24 family protein